MVKNNYGIFDSCARIFINTFLAENDDVAVRSFKRDIQKAPDSVPVDDFILFKLGTYDDEKGEYANDKQILLKGFECFDSQARASGGDLCSNTLQIQTDQK